MTLYESSRHIHYKNLIKLNSFCLNSINKYVWNIRNNMRYVFFFIYKKNIILKLLYQYKIIMNILRIDNNWILYNYQYYLFHLFSLLKINIIDFYKKNILCLCLGSTNNIYLFTYYKANINLYQIYNVEFNKIIKINNNAYFLFKDLNNFILLYRDYVFILYLWLYSIKLLNFYKLNISSIPSKKSLYTVLRSPHKDKKSREQFKISKIKKSFFYPSFLNCNNNLLFKNFVNETILIKHIITINKY